MARLMTRLSLLAAVLVLVLVRSVAIAADEPTAGLEAKITKALGDWQVPGLAIAYIAGRGMQALLVGVQPSDPIALGVAVGATCLTALLGCARPALRAARVDPSEALRAE